MSSIKRKALDDVLKRRVRARREPSVEIEEESTSDNPALNSEEHSDPEDQDSNDESNPSSSEDDESEPEAAESISFGALAKASESLSGTKKKRPAIPTPSDGWANNEALERKAGRADRRDFGRSSKHAPTEISSKKAVSRKREVIPVLKRDVRDPRFEPVTGLPVDEARVRKAYGFLEDYREDEMKELRGAIRKEKDEEQKEKLKRALGAMENRKKARERREREEAVLERHRKEEKELVKQGKQPYYLKQKEVDKRVLVDTFGDLKGKKLERVIERRRKKVEGKEKKKMPAARRATGE
ncbi:rRNA biogenesis protein [Lachnellula hyalina]|uniref:rRNA biogenesis protein RRP36 n=1 Tax=Lachnellula hyalina TaxID=1316788 RepID=A0A8H8R0F5_9HELO|nr:rRNA biogenesis protein [Lachnellula hyalina]TVY25401.1 rRNA biogenesis protein [Lachnellula hyalina]